VTYGDRKSGRVKFEGGLEARLVGIDGTWHRNCTVSDISATGAKISIHEQADGIDLKEFFLLLSSVRAVHRRCKLVRRIGDEVGVIFLKTAAEGK
jgi:hypothetical protein